MSLAAARKRVFDRGTRPVECSKTLSFGKRAYLNSQQLGYVFLPNPGNTRPTKDPRAKTNPCFENRKVRVVKVTDPFDCFSIPRSDEGSWRLSSLGNKRIQLYVHKDFQGDAIAEARKLIDEINGYVNMRRRNGFKKPDPLINPIYECYITPPKRMHPLIAELERKGWPAVVQGKDIHQPTAEYYGYRRLNNKIKVEQGERVIVRRDKEWAVPFFVHIVIYVRDDKLTPTAVRDYIRSIEKRTFVSKIDDGNWGLP